VRAGIVEDPKDYRWCGYAEAMAGDRVARRGFAAVLSGVKADAHWGDVGPRYRKVMFGIGEETSVRAGISREEVARVWAEGGVMTLEQLLRCTVRYLSDGLAIGTGAFVEKIFESARGAFSAKRETGARKMKGGGWGELRTARALKVDAVVPPDGDG
jgi:putative transposase